MVTGRSVLHPVFARLYPRMASATDRGGMAEHRAELLADRTGQVLESTPATARTSRTTHPPSHPSWPSNPNPPPPTRHHRAEHAPVAVQVVDGLPAGDASTDAVIATLVPCSIPDQQTALREIRRLQGRCTERGGVSSPGS